MRDEVDLTGKNQGEAEGVESWGVVRCTWRIVLGRAAAGNPVALRQVRQERFHTAAPRVIAIAMNTGSVSTIEPFVMPAHKRGMIWISEQSWLRIYEDARGGEVKRCQDIA